VTKFCAGTILTSQVMDCQTRVIGKAIRPLFAEPVTYMDRCSINQIYETVESARQCRVGMCSS